MDKNYRYELLEVLKNEYKKNGFSKKLRSEIECLIKDLKDEKKLALMYRYKFSIFNNGIKRKDLESVYIKLFNKIRTYKIIEEYNYFSDNIYTTIFGNMEVIYRDFGLDFINKVVDIYVTTNDKEKEKLLEKIFIGIYKTEDKEYINMILDNIDSIKEEHISNLILETINESFLEHDLIKDNKKEILDLLLRTNSEYNSKILTEFIKNIVNNKILTNNIVNLFKVLSTEQNEELVKSYFKIIKISSINNNVTMQEKCLITLKEISESGSNVKLYCEVLLNVILKIEDEFIQNYFLEKIKTIKNEKSLKLIIHLVPLLKEYSSKFEIIKVINSLEDENNTLTKRLVINLDK